MPRPRHPLRTEQLLIVLDIDGTIMLEDESLDPVVVEAVEHAARARSRGDARDRPVVGEDRAASSNGSGSRPSTWCARTAPS